MIIYVETNELNEFVKMRDQKRPIYREFQKKKISTKIYEMQDWKI